MCSSDLELSFLVEIRKFKSGDEQAVETLITGIMNEEFPQTKDAYPSEDLRDIPRVYGKSGEAFFVATNQNHIVGTVAIKREDDRTALLRRIFVVPTHRNQRIGVRLIEHAIDFCKQTGYEEVVFKTSSKMDKAIRLCENKGFQQRAKLEVGGLELLRLVLFLG